MRVLGIDIGGSHIKTGIVDGKNIIDAKCFVTPESYQKFVALVEDIFEQYDTADFSKVACSVPGAVANGVVEHGGSIPYLDQVDLRKLLAQMGCVPAAVENDAKAATLGEMSKGNLQNIKNGAAIILGTGVGMGIEINHQVYKGTHLQAGEISFMIQDHTVLSPNSFVGMGLSAVGLIGRLAKILDIEADGKKVFKKIQEQNNSEANQVFNEYCKDLAKLCFNIQTVLDIGKIVIGGGISQQSQLIKTVQTEYENIFKISPLISKTMKKIEITEAYFKANANLIGAAEVSTNE
jgi:predicted NBD/HSP70 family sugar kinase